MVTFDWTDIKYGHCDTIVIQKSIFPLFNIPTYEPESNKTCSKTCATSDASDQPAHPRSLIRIYADRLSFLQPPGYPKKDEQELLPC